MHRGSMKGGRSEEIETNIHGRDLSLRMTLGRWKMVDSGWVNLLIP